MEVDMKTLVRKRPNLFPMASFTFFILVLAFFFALTDPLGVAAGERVTFEGTLRGANCTHYKLDCLDDESHIAIENDFILILPDDTHYFMPNLSRALKARYANKAVRVRGEVNIKNHYIWVDILELKKRNTYQPIWSWKEQQELYKGGGG
jgi:hypothetical protein